MVFIYFLKIKDFEVNFDKYVFEKLFVLRVKIDNF